MREEEEEERRTRGGYPRRRKKVQPTERKFFRTLVHPPIHFLLSSLHLPERRR